MPHDTFEYLAGSDNRLAVLRALDERGPLSPRGLEERVGASRRTLKRTVDGLTSRGWLTPVEEGYELTALGGATLSAYESFRERQRTADRLSPFLRHVPARIFDLGLDALTDANLVVADEDAPYGPIDRMLDIRVGTDRLGECVPFLLSASIEQFHERLDRPTPPTVTLIVGETLPPSVERAPKYREGFGRLIDAPTVEVYRYPDDVPVGFGVADDHAFVGVPVDDRLHALIDGTDPALVEWVESAFEDALAASTPVD